MYVKKKTCGREYFHSPATGCVIYKSNKLSLSEGLSLALVDVERSDGLALLLWQSNLSELVLILCHILLQSHKQTLCMLRCKDYAGVDDCLWQTWQHACEVSDEL